MAKRADGVDPQTGQAVIERDHAQCVVRVTHPQQARPGQQIHHRKARAMGGTTDPEINAPANLIYVCAECHAWIESHRVVAGEKGWVIGSATIKHPIDVPLKYLGRWVTLTNYGHVVTVKGKEE